MKKWAILATGLLIVAVVAGMLTVARPRGTSKALASPSIKPGSKSMKLTSAAFKDGTAMPEKYGCQGAGVNPPLTIADVPYEVEDLALVVDDPDAPGGTFDHWVVWNLPVSLTEIPENWSPPAGVSVGANGVGKSVWTAPCPPSGTHHYHFKLYALDGKLDLAPGATKAQLEAAMQGHVVAQAELVGTYTKK